MTYADCHNFQEIKPPQSCDNCMHKKHHGPGCSCCIPTWDCSLYDFCIGEYPGGWICDSYHKEEEICEYNT